MIITRTPFRVSFAGGGSDLEAYYRHEPGAVLCTAIDKYVYLAVNERFGNTFRVSYSRTQVADSVDEIEHPIVRESLRAMSVKRGLEIVSIADLPARSGIGSSSSFTVGLLHALYAIEGKVVTAKRLAEEACRLEIERLGEPIGKQDQHIAAYGGLQFMRFNSDGTVFVDPVVCRPEARHELNRRLLMFFTGMTRDAREVLSRQQACTASKLTAIRRLCGIAGELRDVLTCGRDLNGFGRLLHEAWQTKRGIEESISNPRIDAYYDRALQAGALGGKLLGAGGGGFLLLFCEPHHHDRLRAELSDLTEVPFALEPEGTKIVHIGSNRW